eukprot:7927415-Alexandrium_andersonii.AAC.1
MFTSRQLCSPSRPPGTHKHRTRARVRAVMLHATTVCVCVCCGAPADFSASLLDSELLLSPRCLSSAQSTSLAASGR